MSGTNIILLEMPFFPWSDLLKHSVENLCFESDFRIVLAHIERYAYHDIEALCQAGALCQMNADCLSSIFVDRKYSDLISDGSLVALGSDIHGVKPGYEKWNKAKKRHKDLFETVMSGTNQLLFKTQEY